jgi:hypothetical protein
MSLLQRCAGLTCLILFLASCDNESALNREPEVDIGVAYIKRLPEYSWEWNEENPEVAGWPSPGEEVTWVGVIKNHGNQTVRNFSYQWKLNNEIVGSGTIDQLKPGKSTNVEFLWTWEFDRSELQLEIDISNEWDEASEENNTLLVFTDALSIGFYVEESLYDYYAKFQTNGGRNSWDDWAQEQIATINTWFASSKYDLAPEGALDRYRLNEITIVDDGSLPLFEEAYDVIDSSGGFDRRQSIPNYNDRNVDLQWGFPSELLEGYYDRSNDNFGVSRFLIHEMGHARYLLDNYAFDVVHNSNNSLVDITYNNESVVNSLYLPGDQVNNGYYVHKGTHKGIMYGFEYSNFSLLSVLILNHLQGQRPAQGNFNTPLDQVDIYNLFPDEFRFQVVNNQGEPIPGATIDVYQSNRPQTQDPNSVYPKHYDNIPDVHFQTDANGEFTTDSAPRCTRMNLNSASCSSRYFMDLRRVKLSSWVVCTFTQ